MLYKRENKGVILGFYLISLMFISLISHVSAFEASFGYSDTICEPNHNFCSDDAMKVLLCGSNGRTSTEVKSCSSAEVCSLVGTSFDCIKKTDMGDSSQRENFLYLLIIISIILIVYFTIKSNKKKH